MTTRSFDAQPHDPPDERERAILIRGSFLRLVEAEVDRAYEKHGRDPWGRHEMYAILREEVDELWDAVKRDEPTDHVLDELVQVAAMCLRYFETGDRYRGGHGLAWGRAIP